MGIFPIRQLLFAIYFLIYKFWCLLYQFLPWSVDPKPPFRTVLHSSSTVTPKGKKIPCAIPCHAGMSTVLQIHESLINFTKICPSLSDEK